MELSHSLRENIDAMKAALRIPDSGDAKMCEFEVGGVAACLFYMEGMAGLQLIDRYILYPSRAYRGEMDCEPDGRAEFMSQRILDGADVSTDNQIKRIVGQVMDGNTALMLDGCADALVIETRNYEKRNVGKTVTESVVMGAQQGFVESVRSNITLMRRIIKSPQLTTEMLSVGSEMPTSLALLYLKGSCNEAVLNEARRRILSLEADIVPDVGHLQQLIEDRPNMLLPQMLLTERPDRASYLVAEGYIAIMMDNSPYALILPVSLFEFMFTADDLFMRWQYSTFNRIVRFLGLFVSLLLPGLYIALTLYHTQMIPLELLTSIADARAMVPFPVIVELLIMEFSYYLINEAGTRMPSQIGSALGILGALILGQAAVSANIISPMLIIIAALTGLGNYAIPDYGLSISVQVMRLAFLAAGAAMGLLGIAMMLLICMSSICAMQSFGQPYVAPYAPWRGHAKGLLFCHPLWRRNRLPFFVPANSWHRRTPDGDRMRGWEGRDK